MICVGILVTYCFAAQPQIVDSFCEVYQPIVQAKGEGAISAQIAVKKRILTNELTHRRLCGEIQPEANRGGNR